MKPVLFALLSLTLIACSSTGRYPGQTPVIVDTQGVDIQKYESDLADCEELAQKVPVLEKAVVRGAVGTVVGGAVGAVIDGSDGAATGAGVGGVLGTAKGGARGVNQKERVLRRCLKGRGYRVLS